MSRMQENLPTIFFIFIVWRSSSSIFSPLNSHMTIGCGVPDTMHSNCTDPSGRFMIDGSFSTNGGTPIVVDRHFE